MRAAGIPVRLVTVAAADLRERVRRLPGMDRLLPALEDCRPRTSWAAPCATCCSTRPRVRPRPGGGGRRPRGRARELAARLGGALREHERFGTATVRDGRTSPRPRHHAARALHEPGRAARGGGGAARRGPRPARLHDQRHGVGLTETTWATCSTRTAASPTCEAGWSGCCTSGASWTTPPGSCARSATRRGSGSDGRGHRAPGARGGGRRALVTVSGSAHARRAAAPARARWRRRPRCERLRELGLDRALHPALRPGSRSRGVGGARRACAIGADRVLAALAALCAGARGARRRGSTRFSLNAASATRVLARRARGRRSSRRRSAARATRRRAVRPAGSRAARGARAGAGAGRAARAGAALRDRPARVRLEITGDDLIAAGVPESPAIGRALEETLG